MTDDFFRARLEQMIDLKHPLAALANRLPWTQLEATLAPAFAHRHRDGKRIEDSDLFGPTLAIAGAGMSAAGRPRLSIRLMASLLYLATEPLAQAAAGGGTGDWAFEVG